MEITTSWFLSIGHLKQTDIWGNNLVVNLAGWKYPVFRFDLLGTFQKDGPKGPFWKTCKTGPYGGGTGSVLDFPFLVKSDNHCKSYIVNGCSGDSHLTGFHTTMMSMVWVVTIIFETCPFVHMTVGRDKFKGSDYQGCFCIMFGWVSVKISPIEGLLNLGK